MEEFIPEDRLAFDPVVPGCPLLSTEDGWGTPLTFARSVWDTGVEGRFFFF